MKRVITVIFSFCILLSVVLAFSLYNESKAATPPVLTVDAKTVSLKEMVYIKYFVVTEYLDSPENEVQLLLWKKDGDRLEDSYYTKENAEKTVEWAGTYNADRLVFQWGVSTKEMGDVYITRLCAEKDSQTYYGNIIEYGVGIYSSKMLQLNDLSEKDRTVIRKMLEYGAAMQEYCGYNADHPVTEVLEQYYPNYPEDPKITKQRVESTCTEPGWTEEITCASCGKIISSPAEIPAGHKYVTTVHEPTNTANGYTEYSCSGCGDYYIDNIIPPSGSSTFNLKYTVNDDSTTCTVTGLGENDTSTVIKIPDKINGLTVTGIKEYAFYSKSGLIYISLPDSLESIGDGAFSSCTSLTSITIPESVTSIGEQAFLACAGLTSITVDSNNSVYDSRENCNAIIEKSSSTLIAGCKNTEIPNNVLNIGNFAFEGCTGLTSIAIPNSVTSIGNSAFSSCTTLASITLGNSVQSIGDYAFRGCTGLTSITIPDSVTSLGVVSFDGCANLESVTIGNGITDIEESTFLQCKKLSGVTIGNSVQSIGKNAFKECTSLTSITIPKSVTSIGGYAFYGCTGLTSITIPDSVTSIGESTFYKCTSLTSIIIPDGVESIGSGAFYNCKSLTSITIPNNVTGIGASAFYECTNLTNIIIPDSVTSIGGFAFGGCTSLTSVTIGKNVTSIGSYAFDRCSIGLTSIVVAPDNPKYDSRNGCNALIETSTNTLIVGCRTTVIPDTVTIIGAYAFEDCAGLTSITIGEKITSIGSSAFKGCVNLESIVVESGNQKYDSRNSCNAIIKKSNNMLIAGCKNTVIPDGVTNIGDYAFWGCTDLTDITIPNNVTDIGDYAFGGCTGLTSITIPGSVTSIGISPFSGCTNLKSIAVESGNVIFDSRNSCNAIIETGTNKLIVGCKTTVIPDTVTIIGKFSFSGCTGLTGITIPESVTKIEYKVFIECSNLTSITFNGTQEQWNLIEKGEDWDIDTGNYTIHYTE